MSKLSPNNSTDISEKGMAQKIVLKVATHVKHTRSQRMFVNIKINKAKETDLSLSLIPIPQKERIQIIVINYCQKLNVQNFVHDGEAPMRELNIIMDICAGQNKDRVVICPAVCMMETGMFSKVDLIFLIKGQTKNMCNCMFNTMK